MGIVLSIFRHFETDKMNIAVLDSPVLVLNSLCFPMEEKNVRRAIEDMTSGRKETGWKPPFRGLDIELTDDGELHYFNPVEWEEWIQLPVRPGDGYITSAHMKIRAPTVIMSRHFDKAHVRPVRLTYSAVKKRDKHQCQYCGHYFPMSELNIDHVIPRYHGGRDSWDNLVCSCIPCNSKKGHRKNSEIGYKLLKEPKQPPHIAQTIVQRECKHPTWAPFLRGKQ